MINPAHAKALKAQDRRQRLRALAELFECGCCAVVYPCGGAEEVRDLTRYR